MPQKSEVKECERLVYIEPNNFINESNKVSFADGVAKDNIYWNPEDLQYTVDLQVIMNSREDCGQPKDFDINKINTSIENGDNWVSFMQGEKYDDTKNNMLTTAYTNISYQGFTSDGKVMNETLGITNININFDSHFFPLITINFTDVRGSSLFMPAEYEAMQDERIRQGANPDDLKQLPSSFFKSLFHFPYPRFMLSIKGFYGDRVTFQLAVSDFKTAFNSQTGNFDVTVSFIGYMYGLYTDIPMNLVLCAPYYNAKYWESQIENRVFTYNDGGGIGSKILTYLEFLEKYYNLSINMDTSEFVGPVKNLVYFNDKKNQLSKVRNVFKIFYEQFNLYNKNGCVGCDKDDERCIIYSFFSKSEKLENVLFPETYKSLKDIIDKYNDGIEDDELKIENIFEKYNNLYDLEVKDPLTIESTRNENNELEFKYSNTNISIDEQARLKKYNSEILKINTTGKTSYYYYCFDGSSFLENIDNVSKKLDEKISDAQDPADAAMKNVVNDKLGFKPSLENIYRMTFAHIETFIMSFNDVLTKIKNNDNNEKRQSSYLNINKDNSDVSKFCKNDTFIPAFPLLKVNNEIVYPGDSGTTQQQKEMDEVKYIDDIVNSIKSVTKGMKDILDNISKLNEEKEAEKTAEENETMSMNFIPSSPFDLYYHGNNPYYKLRDKIENGEVSDGEIPGYVAYFIFTRFLAYWNSRPTNENGGYTEEEAVSKGYVSNKIKSFDEFAENEIKNFKNSGIKFTNEIKSLLINYEDFYEKVSDMCKNNPNFFKIDGGETQYLYIDDPFNKNNSNAKNVLTSSFNKCLMQIDSKEFGNKSIKTFADGYGKSGILQDCTDLSTGDFGVENLYNFSLIRKNDGVSSYKTMSLSNEDDNAPDKTEIKQMISDYENGIDINNYLVEMLQIYDQYNINHLYLKKQDDGSISYDGSVMSYISDKKTRAVYLLSSLSAYFKKGDYVTQYMNYVENGPMLIKMPKVLYYYIGACIYAHDNIDIIEDYGKYAFFGVLNSYNLKLKEGYFDLCSKGHPYKYENEVSGPFFGFLEGTGDSESGRIRGRGLFEYAHSEDRLDLNKIKLDFENWVVSDEFKTLDEELKKVNSTNYQNSCKILECEIHEKRSFDPSTIKVGAYSNGSTTAQKLLRDLLCESLFFAKRTLKHNHSNEKFTDNFKWLLRNNLCDKFKDKNTITTKEEDDISDALKEDYTNKYNQKRALYYTLKRLYDKWLCSYSSDDFKLGNPIQDKENRHERYCSSNPSVKQTEFNSFLYIDSFYNDISDDFIVDPTTVVDMIKAYIGNEVGNVTTSVFEFMAHIAEKNHLLFLSLPVYNNLYNGESIKRIFTPHEQYKYDDAETVSSKRTGNTHLIIYTGEVSSKLEMDDENGYQGDGIVDVFGLGDSQIPTEVSHLFEEKGGKDNYKIPAFGVTFGRQDQMYFKNISVNMDNPKVTDYSIANLLQIAQAGAHGSNEDLNVGVGQNIYSIYSNRSYTCTVEMLGCMNIMPMMYFQLNNIPMFRGFYIIINVSHTIVPGNVITKFTGVRVSKNHIGNIDCVFDYQSLMDKIRGEKWDGVISSEYSNYDYSKVGKREINNQQKENAKIIAKELQKAGYNKYAISGIIGTVCAESSLEYKAINKGEKDGTFKSSGACYGHGTIGETGDKAFNNAYSYGAGLLQWTYFTRKLKVLGYAKGKGNALSYLKNVEVGTRIPGTNGGIESCSLSEQTRMIIGELDNTFKNVKNILSSVNNVHDATKTVYSYYVGHSNVKATEVPTDEKVTSVVLEYIKANSSAKNNSFEAHYVRRLEYANYIYSIIDELLA